jgi:hypothetical protein
MRTLVWLGSAISLLAAAAVPGCGSGGLGGGGSSNSGNCNSFCAAMLKPQCSNAGTQAECLQGCQSQTAAVPSQCAAQASSLLSCFSTANYTCSPSGTPTTSACTSEAAALETCKTSTGSGGSNGAGGTGATGCSSECARTLAAACANDTLESCLTNCASLQNASASRCSGQFSALQSCRETATFTCNVLGNATTSSCSSQQTALQTCRNSIGTGGTGTGGTGTGGTSGAPAGWTCSSDWYGSYDGCDCGCTLADPDCAGSGCSAPGCNASRTYTACVTSNGTATGTGGTSGVPAGWTCTSIWYGTQDGCDCGCSLPDPDCNGSGCSAPGCNASRIYSACITSS